MKKLFAAVSLLLICAAMVNLTGCAAKIEATSLTDDITPNPVQSVKVQGTPSANMTDFAVRLFKQCGDNGENTLISPLSVIYALAMTVNGAEGDTKEQMEAVLGMTAEELNLYLYSYMQDLPQGDRYKLTLANSIWFSEDGQFEVNQDFLQKNADYYKADIYKAPFNDQTRKDINTWVNEKTDGMIPEILDRISNDAVMYLVNALTFDAEWRTVYFENQVREGKFTTADGTKQSVSFMYSCETEYLEDEKAIGFMKPYCGGRYAFVAMLPKEGIRLEDYVSSLDGAALNALLTNPQAEQVNAAIPKFETEYNVEMSDVLRKMGMTDAFDADRADFSRIGTNTDENLYINRVIHKTFISVGEKGTKAGAASIVEMNCGAVLQPEEPKIVYLDRPFVYMLVDKENGVPFFMGTMMDLSK